MVDTFDISFVIYCKLKSDAAIVDKVVDRIYPVVANEGTQTPYIVFSRDIVNDIADKDLDYREQADVTVTCVADTHADSVELARKVRRVLNRAKLTTDDSTIELRDVRLTSCTEDYTDDCYTQELTFHCSIESK